MIMNFATGFGGGQRYKATSFDISFKEVMHAQC